MLADFQSVNVQILIDFGDKNEGTDSPKCWNSGVKGCSNIKNFILEQVLGINPIKPDGVSQRHTLHLIASHFYMNEENEVSFHEFLSWTILYPLKK